MDGGEQRQYPRIGLGMPVTLVFSKRGVTLNGELHDISRGGCFFKASVKVELDRKISIAFLVTPDRDCRASGHVIRTTAYKGFAVLFEEANEAVFEFIKNVTVLPHALRAQFLTNVLNPEIQIL
jgi:hypothetical protein